TAQKPPSCAGRLYAAKAPGPSILAVPVLAVFRAVGGRLSSKAADVLVLRWVLGILPTIGFWIAMRRWLLRRGASAEAAILVPLAALAHFHLQAFGSVWSTPDSHLENAGFVRDISPGILGISAPTWQRVYGSLFAPYLGLFFWAPWTALALAGAPALIRRGG